VRAWSLDVRDPDGWAQVVSDVQRSLGPPTVLVNNAGIMSLGRLTEQDRDRDRRQLDINVVGVIEGMRAVLPVMRAQRLGHVVNLCSVAGVVGIPHAAVYSASKFAVHGLTDAVRIEEERHGLRFTTVHPSLVQTELITGTGRPRFPPPATPDDVARGVRRALLHDKRQVYVPRIGRLTALVPAWVGARNAERIGRLLGLDTMFATTTDARAAYEARAAKS
jgi:NADP-dependent 3-hydroxy acid dehydrogenase YdfG